MSRTTLLQERRMQTFQNVLGHWQARRLSALEAAEMLGMSERSFRRYRRRYEDDGLDGLFDRRLDKASARRCRPTGSNGCSSSTEPAIRATVKDHLCAHHGFAWSYTWDHLAARRLGVQGTQARRPPSPAPAQARVGMAPSRSRHELAGQAACDLIVTMDDATSEIYSAFLVEEEGTASTFRALRQVFTDKGMPSASTPTVTTSTPPRPARSPRINTPRSAAPSISSASSTSLPIRRPAAAPSALRHPPGPPRQGTGIRRSKPPTASSQTPTCPTTIAASPPRPSSTTAPSCPSSAPTRRHRTQSA